MDSYRQAYDKVTGLQNRVMIWGTATFGAPHMFDVHERIGRLQEEVAELAQACFVPQEVLHLIVSKAYTKLPGDVRQELGGVGLCVLAVAGALRDDFLRETERELVRVEALPVEHFRQRHHAKVLAGYAGAAIPPQGESGR